MNSQSSAWKSFFLRPFSRYVQRANSSYLSEDFVLIVEKQKLQNCQKKKKKKKKERSEMKWRAFYKDEKGGKKERKKN